MGRWGRWGLLGLAVGAGLILFCFDPAQHSFYPFCPLHRLTGLLCPGCGSLRALHALVHGEWGAAWRFNPLLVLSLPLALWLGLRAWMRSRSGPVGPARTLPPGWEAWALVIVVLFGILRNLPHFPLSPWMP